MRYKYALVSLLLLGLSLQTAQAWQTGYSEQIRDLAKMLPKITQVYSKSELGMKFWRQARKYSDAQMDLFE